MPRECPYRELEVAEGAAPTPPLSGKRGRQRREPALRRCPSRPETATGRRPVRVILSSAHSYGDQRKTGATYYRCAPGLFFIILVWLSLFSCEASMLADIGRFAQASSQGN